MSDQELGQEIRESANGFGKHDRVKRGYWPEKFGDVEITIDLDHPQADKVRTREQLEAEQVAAAQAAIAAAEQAERAAKEAAEREAAEKAQRDREQREKRSAK